ncbi:hypothetical protein XCR1_1480003 [Xenorhabdus cabanillasii JM26]|uniref:Uncharacterized protein n=1 Tax=Xenorhabdus cabanillasii JM26 TaxID=1427517 RepID=W1IT17_9GAMM|nr:hypothetical protein XCR1_1480003 [Xenorhabdus cabanillasii JM26]
MRAGTNPTGKDSETTKQQESMPFKRCRYLRKGKLSLRKGKC